MFNRTKPLSTSSSLQVKEVFANSEGGVDTLHSSDLYTTHTQAFSQEPLVTAGQRATTHFLSYRVMLGVAAVLTLLGGATFAVSSLTPTKPVVQERELQELLTPPDYATQLKSILNMRMGMHLYRSDTSRASDTVESLFQRLSVDDQEAERFIRNSAPLRKNLLAKSGRPIRVEVDEQNRIVSLKLLWPQGEGNYFELEMYRKNMPNDDQALIDTEPTNSASLFASNSFKGPSSTSSAQIKAKTNPLADSPFNLTLQTHPMHASVRLATGRIQTSLYSATDAAHIPDTVAAQMADLFAGEIDFHRSLQKGDHFTLMYEALDADGEPMGYGKIIGAEFVSNGVTHQAIFFQERGSKEGNYFNLNGQSLKRTYLASPLKYSRITSGYKMRFHPILQTWKAHKGIDYAAPTGTAVHTVGKGVVKSAGWINGLGNVVFVDHGNSQTTVYAHLSEISVRPAQVIEQGQKIGAVGDTGWATGPHLHFEFRINDQYKDPSTIARQSTPIVLSKSALADFNQQASAIRLQLSRNNNDIDDPISLNQ